MRRVLVVGMSGAGKTTAARALATRLDLPMYEMDDLAIGPGWSTRMDLLDNVRQITTEPGWVFDSWGYPAVRDLMWDAADTVVWLDYPRRVVLPRLIRRSLGRTVRRTQIFGGNRETWRGWFKADHPVWFAIRTFETRRRYLRARTETIPTIRLRSPAELDQWLTEQPS